MIRIGIERKVIICTRAVKLLLYYDWKHKKLKLLGIAVIFRTNGVTFTNTRIGVQPPTVIETRTQIRKIYTNRWMQNNTNGTETNG